MHLYSGRICTFTKLGRRSLFPISRHRVYHNTIPHTYLSFSQRCVIFRYLFIAVSVAARRLLPFGKHAHTRMEWLTLSLFHSALYCHGMKFDVHVYWWQGSNTEKLMQSQRNKEKILVPLCFCQFLWVYALTDENIYIYMWLQSSHHEYITHKCLLGKWEDENALQSHMCLGSCLHLPFNILHNIER